MALRQGAYDFAGGANQSWKRRWCAPARRRAERERERAEHLRHVAEVALTLAHEINNPLAIPMGELQLQLR